MGAEGGGGGTQQRFVLGGSALRSNPSPFCVPFLTEKVPLKGQKARKADRTRMFSKPNDSKVQIQWFLSKYSSNRMIWTKKKFLKDDEDNGTLKDYLYQDDGKPGERSGSEAVVMVEEFKRPLKLRNTRPCYLNFKFNKRQTFSTPCVTNSSRV